MENNDRNRLIELLEEADIRETMTEGFDQWCTRRIRRRQAIRRTCVVLLLFGSVAAFAVTFVPSLHRLVFPAVEPVDTLPSPTLAPVAVPQSEVEPTPDTVAAISEPMIVVAEPAPEPVAVAEAMPPSPRYDFICVTPMADTLACFLLPDGSVAVACLAAAARVIVPEAVEHNGHSYAVTALADSAFFSLTSVRSVTLPSTLTVVGKDAFSLCSGIDTLVLLAAEPPVVVGEWCFFGMADTVSLTVPCGTAAAYRNAPQWDGFEHVVDPCEPQHKALSEVTIIVNGNTIVVEGADDETVDVYDAQGRLVATAQCNGRCSIALRKDNLYNRMDIDIYWVQVGSRSRQRVSLGANHNTPRNNIFINQRDLEATF
jgi:hypothetical protein